MPTALDIITGALKKIGQYAPGETLAASDANDALDTLNGMIDMLSNEHLFIYNNVENVLTLTPGKQSYTVGAGGEFNIPRPLRLTNIYTRITTGSSSLDFPCQEVSGDKYTKIGLKTQPGPWPKMAYYNTGFPLAQLFLWPVPSQAGELHMWSDMVLNTMALGDPVTLPQGYYLYLQYQLATLLAPEYGTDDSNFVKVSKIADAMKRKIKSLNATPQADVSLDVAFVNGGVDAGWILNGGFQ